MTDVEGLYRSVGDDDSLIQKMNLSDARTLHDSGSISGGMLPKLESCIAAMDAGVRRAHILDGRVQHALLLEIFTPEGIGTMIRQDGED